MASINIVDGKEEIDEIFFTLEDIDADSGVTKIYIDVSGEITFNSDYLKSEHLSNFIKALEKARELGWGT